MNSEINRDARSSFASRFGQEIDPLVKYERDFQIEEANGNDPFELFVEERLRNNNRREGTIEGYQTTIKHWREFMAERGRHPACPNEEHARQFIEWLADGNQSSGRGNTEGTIITKIRNLSRIWEYWQKEPSLPAEFAEFDPFELALDKTDLRPEQPRDPPKVPIEDLREVFGTIGHLRERSMAALQFKLGLRAGEVVNIRIEDLHISGRELRDHYPELGTNPMLDGEENAICIPPRGDKSLPWEGRDGNKSRRPRVMPLDDELRRVIRQLLLIRPENPDGWLLLSKRAHRKLEPMYVNEAMKTALDELNDDKYRDITSHFGRHYFSTHWRNLGVNPEAIKYMRGDTTSEEVDGRDALSHYIHSYYEDIEQLYLDNIYKLHI